MNVYKTLRKLRFIAVLTLGLVVGGYFLNSESSKSSGVSKAIDTVSNKTSQVLGASDDRRMRVNIPGIFDKGLEVLGETVLRGNLKIEGDIESDNIISEIAGGEGILVSRNGSQVVVTNSETVPNIFSLLGIKDGVSVEPSTTTSSFLFEAGDNVSLAISGNALKISSTDTGESSPWQLNSDVLSPDSINYSVAIGKTTASSMLDVAGIITAQGLSISGDVTFGALTATSSLVTINSGTLNTAGLKFSQLTSSSPVGSGGGKVLSVDSGGNLILVTDESGGTSEGDLDTALPGASLGATIYWDGSTWAHTTNLYHDGGKVGISTVSPDARLTINTNDAATEGLQIIRAASQTENLLEFLDSDASTILSYFDENGVFNGDAVLSGSFDPGLTEGAVTFQGASGITGDATNLFWDDTSNELGIGTNNPSYGLDVSGTTRLANTAYISSSGVAYGLTLNHYQIAGSTAGVSLVQSNSSLGLTSTGAISATAHGGQGVTLRSNQYNSTADATAFDFQTSTSPASWSTYLSRLTILGNGNVGMGTASPNDTLEVLSTTDAQLRLAYDTSNYHSLQTSSDGGLVWSARGTDADLNIDFSGATDGDFSVNTDDLFVDTSTGRVGIGTTAPATTLEVGGTIRSSTSFQIGSAFTTSYASATGTSFISHASGRALTFNTSATDGANTEQMRITSAGLVGIGSTSPTANLHVTSTATSLSANGLTYLNWNPSSAATLAGDLVGINAGANATVGSLFNITNNGSSVFKVTQSKITSALPHEFTAAGDVSVGYDLEFLNSTVANIISNSSLYLKAGPSYASNDLVLETYNNGNVVIDSRSLNVGGGVTRGLLTVDNTYRSLTGKALLSLNQVESQDILTASASGTTKFRLTHDGNLALTAGTKLMPLSNSTSAINIANAAGTSFVSFDTTNSRVGIGSSTPSSNLHIYQASPTANQGLFLIGTSDDSSRFSVDEDGDVSSDGGLNFGGGNVVLGTSGQTNTINNLTNSQTALTLNQNGAGAVGGALTINTNAASPGLLIVGASSQSGDYLQIRSNGGSGGDIFAIDSAGDVGIGTSSPSTKFDIYDGTNTNIRMNPNMINHSTPFLYGSYAGNNTLEMSFNDSSSTNNWGRGALFKTSVGGRGFTFAYPSNSDFRLTGSTSTDAVRLLVDGSGNVGIGTSTPTSKLHVNGAVTGKALTILNETGDQDILAASASGTTRFVVKNDGKVGIGTSSPGSSLQINSGSNSSAITIVGSSGNNSYIYNNAGSLTLVGSSNNAISIASNIQIGNANTTSFLIGNSGSVLKADFSTGNIGIGTTTFGTDAAKVLALSGSTAPSTAITDGIQLFAVDSAGSHELQVMDEAGNTTTLSPHNFSLIPDGPSEDLAWSFYSERGTKAINADMTKALRLIERLSGEKVIHVKDLETGEELGGEIESIESKTLASLDQLFEDKFGKLVKLNYQLWTFIEEVIFEKPVEFADKVLFKKSPVFEDKNIAGMAVIPVGGDHVEVKFDPILEVENPLIHITQSNTFVDHTIEEVSKEGFKIKLNSQALGETKFTWLVTQVKEYQTVVGPTPTPSPSPNSESNNTSESEEGNTPTPTPSPTSSPATEASGSGETVN